MQDGDSFTRFFSDSQEKNEAPNIFFNASRATIRDPMRLQKFVIHFHDNQ